MIYAIVAILLAMIAFFIGFKVAKSIYTTKDIKLPKKPLFSFKQAKETEEERIQRITMENIENYGTGLPQQEVR